MIKSLGIQNFQSHRDSSLEFSPGVNVIVGTSDSGKTAVLRALKWVINNRPSGEAFRSTWGGDTSVSIEVDDKAIERFKSSKSNLYFVNEQEYEGFGTKVPDEVQKILNIDETNLQAQFDAPFLISESPGEVAAYFNKIARLDQIDSGLKSIAASMRVISVKTDTYTAQLKDAHASEAQYEYLDKFEADLESLEALQVTITGKRQNKAALELLIGRIGEVEKEIEGHGGIILFEKKVDHILALYAEKETVWGKLDAVQEARAEIGKIESDIEYINEEAKLLPNVDSLLFQWAARREIIQERNALRAFVGRIVNYENGILDISQTQHENEETFHKFMPDLCPLCEHQKTDI